MFFFLFSLGRARVTLLLHLLPVSRRNMHGRRSEETVISVVPRLPLRPPPAALFSSLRIVEQPMTPVATNVTTQSTLAAAFRKGHAMLLDCRSEEPDAVPLSDSNLVIVVTNSNVKHKLAGSQVDEILAACFCAGPDETNGKKVERLRALLRGVVCLRLNTRGVSCFYPARCFRPASLISLTVQATLTS